MKRNNVLKVKKKVDISDFQVLGLELGLSNNSGHHLKKLKKKK